tara:strand:+ start:2516 stop:6829 length:4314 start_codon:yes stop_codon:yes gene_type:complete
MTLNKIYNLIRIIILVFFLFIQKTSVAQIKDSTDNKINHIHSYLNHANTHFWLGRYWKNALKQFQIANKYVDSAETLLRTTKIDTLSLKSFTLRILNFRNEIAEVEGICVDNMNGRFPLFMSLTGEIDNFEFIDEPIEIAVENSIDKVLTLNTIRPSKPLKELMCYSIVEVYPYDRTIEEVCFQYINNNSNNYIISRHELSQILKKDKIRFNKQDYQKIGQFYGAKAIGKYKVVINDQVDNINYVSTTFDYFKTSSNEIISSTLGEGIVVDKLDVKLKAIFKGSFSYFFIFVLISVVFITLFFRTYLEKKWPSLKDIGSFFLSSSLGLVFSIISAWCILLLVNTYAPSPDDFFKSIPSKLWIISTPLVLGCITPLSSVLLAGLIFKKRILGEKPLIIAFLQGAFVGSIFPLLFHYYILNESASSINVFLLFSLFSIIGAVFSGISYYNFEINPASKRHLFFSILYTTPIIFFNLLLLKNQDSIAFLNIFFLLVIFVPIILIQKYWDSIINLFKKSKSGDQAVIPGKIGALNNVLNATLAYEDGSIRVDFKEVIKNNLINAIKNSYNQPQLGFQKESNKIDVLYIKGPRGIGKTTLLEKELSGLYKEYFYGDCDEFQDGNTIPYEPFVQAFGDIIGQGVFLSGDRNAIKVVEALKPGIEETPIGSLALSMINTNSFAGASLKEICKVFEVFITEKVNSLKSRQPLIFVLEDTHWMDQDTYDLLMEFLKMIRILKKRLKFDFILIVTERVSDKEPRLGSVYDEFLTEIKAEQFYNFNELFKFSQEEETFLVDKDFCSNFLSSCGVEIDYKTRQSISEGFNNLGFYNPGHILESLKYIITHNWLNEENGLVVLKKDADFKNIPLPSQLKEMFAEKFSLLDDELKRILETASFIGENFEANILSEIWQIDRLVLLHKLRLAEELGFVKDVSDKDDVYQFTNKGIIAELRRHASKGLKDEQRPQIVKEYHKMITHIMLEKKAIDPSTFDINIVSQLADRTYYNKDQMFKEAFELNYITAKRSLNKVNTKQAKQYLDRLNELIKDGDVEQSNIINVLLLRQKVYLVDLHSRNFQEALENSEKLTQLFDELSSKHEGFDSMYESFYLDQLQLYFDALRFFNNENYKEKKPNHLSKIEILCNEKSPKIKSNKIAFTQRFYHIEIFLYGDFEKIKLELENLKEEIEKTENNNRVYGRVINSLANTYQRLKIKPQEAKTLWKKRLKMILIECNVGINEDSDLALFKLISSNYSLLKFDLKKDVLYSTGAYSRFVKDHDKNYELALELSKIVQNLNLIAGDYMGYSISSNYISLCYIELYKVKSITDFFNEAFYFNEEVFYELENGYQITNGKANIFDSFSQFIILVNWINLIKANHPIDQQMKSSLNNAINDFISIFGDGSDIVAIPEIGPFKSYFSDFKELSKDSKLKTIEPLLKLFESVRISSSN